MKVHAEYTVLFDKDTREQLGYFLQGTTIPNHPAELTKVVKFNPETTKCTLDESSNIVLNIRRDEQPVNVDGISKIEHRDTIKALQYSVAFNLITRLIDVSDRRQSYETIKNNVERILDFNVDDAYNEILEEVNRVKTNNASVSIN